MLPYNFGTEKLKKIVVERVLLAHSCRKAVHQEVRIWTKDMDKAQHEYGNNAIPQVRPWDMAISQIFYKQMCLAKGESI